MAKKKARKKAITSSESTMPSKALPVVYAFGLVAVKGLWHVATLRTQGDRIVDKELTVGTSLESALDRGVRMLAQSSRRVRETAAR